MTTNFLTVSQAAKYLCVRPATVAAWVASGKMRSVRGRGIPQQEILDLCGETVLAFVSGAEKRAIEKQPSTVVASSWWHVAQFLCTRRPRVLVLDVALGREWALEAARNVKEYADGPAVVAIVYEDEDGLPGTDLWDVKLRRPFNVLEAIRNARCM